MWVSLNGSPQSQNLQASATPPQQEVCSGKSGLWLAVGPASMVVGKTICVRSSGHSRGSGSRTSSPGSSKSVVVGEYPLNEVPIAWDNHPTIRERIRNGDNLCLSFKVKEGKGTSEFVAATNENVKLNAAVLRPLCCIMKDHELQLPGIQKLIGAVEEFFVLAKLSRGSDHCYQEGWSIRRLIGKLKRFTYRSTPPQDPYSVEMRSMGDFDSGIFWDNIEPNT